MFVFVMPAVAETNTVFGKGLYFGMAAGKTDNVKNVDASSGVFPYHLGVGYKFNNHFSAEANYGNLYSVAKILNTPSNYDSATLSGYDLGALITFPMGKKVSGFARLGYAKMTSEAEINNLKYSSDLTGTSAGIGVQFNYKPGGWFRVGYNKYSLKNALGGLPLEPRYIYIGFGGM